LSTETSPKVIAAIISARGDPNKTVGKSNEIANLKFKLNIKDLHLNVSNALFQCARRGHTRQTIALIKGGADINEEYDGNTPLGTAILNGHFELIQQVCMHKLYYPFTTLKSHVKRSSGYAF
jgi:ankyrin repeat protein